MRASISNLRGATLTSGFLLSLPLIQSDGLSGSIPLDLARQRSTEPPTHQATEALVTRLHQSLNNVTQMRDLVLSKAKPNSRFPMNSLLPLKDLDILLFRYAEPLDGLMRRIEGREYNDDGHLRWLTNFFGNSATHLQAVLEGMRMTLSELTAGNPNARNTCFLLIDCMIQRLSMINGTFEDLIPSEWADSFEVLAKHTKSFIHEEHNARQITRRFFEKLATFLRSRNTLHRTDEQAPGPTRNESLVSEDLTLETLKSLLHYIKEPQTLQNFGTWLQPRQLIAKFIGEVIQADISSPKLSDAKIDGGVSQADISSLTLSDAKSDGGVIQADISSPTLSDAKIDGGVSQADISSPTLYESELAEFGAIKRFTNALSDLKTEPVRLIVKLFTKSEDMPAVRKREMELFGCELHRAILEMSDLALAVKASSDHTLAEAKSARVLGEIRGIFLIYGGYLNENKVINAQATPQEFAAETQVKLAEMRAAHELASRPKVPLKPELARHLSDKGPSREEGRTNSNARSHSMAKAIGSVQASTREEARTHPDARSHSMAEATVSGDSSVDSLESGGGGSRSGGDGLRGSGRRAIRGRGCLTRCPTSAGDSWSRKVYYNSRIRHGDVGQLSDLVGIDGVTVTSRLKHVVSPQPEARTASGSTASCSTASGSTPSTSDFPEFFYPIRILKADGTTTGGASFDTRDVPHTDRPSARARVSFSTDQTSGVASNMSDHLLASGQTGATRKTGSYSRDGAKAVPINSEESHPQDRLLAALNGRATPDSRKAYLMDCFKLWSSGALAAQGPPTERSYSLSKVRTTAAHQMAVEQKWGGDNQLKIKGNPATLLQDLAADFAALQPTTYARETAPITLRRLVIKKYVVVPSSTVKAMTDVGRRIMEAWIKACQPAAGAARRKTLNAKAIFRIVSKNILADDQTSGHFKLAQISRLSRIIDLSGLLHYNPRDYIWNQAWDEMRILENALFDHWDVFRQEWLEEGFEIVQSLLYPEFEGLN